MTALASRRPGGAQARSVAAFGVDNPRWMDDAACAGTDPELFFPSSGGWDQAVAAKRICAGCPVLADCYAYAVADPTLQGIWGGTNDDERQTARRDMPYHMRLRARRLANAAAAARMRKAGRSVNNIAAVMGVDPNTVTRWHATWRQLQKQAS